MNDILHDDIDANILRDIDAEEITAEDLPPDRGEKQNDSALGEIIDRLNKAAALAVQSEACKRLGANEGLVMVARPPEELDRYVRGEEARWRRVIQDAGIRGQ